MHQVRINEIKKDLFDTTFGKSRLEASSKKDNELFSVLSPQYQRKMTQRIEKRRELEERLTYFEHRAEDFKSREVKLEERRKNNEALQNNDSDSQHSKEIIMCSKKIEKLRNKRSTTALPTKEHYPERSTIRKVSHLQNGSHTKLQTEMNSLRYNLQPEIKNDYSTNTIYNEKSPRNWIMNVAKSVMHKTHNFKVLEDSSMKENIEAKFKRITTSRVIGDPLDFSEIKKDKFDFGDTLRSLSNSCMRSPKSMRQTVSTENNPYLTKLDLTGEVTKINELNLTLSSRSPVTDPDAFASILDRFRSERTPPILFDKVHKLIQEKTPGIRSNREYKNSQDMPMTVRTITTNLEKKPASSLKVNGIYRMASREVRKIHDKFKKCERKALY